MNRTQLINTLILQNRARKYLEIGVSAGDNFRAVECAYKVGVDPAKDAPATHHMTSDEFFLHNKETFDVIFIDGLHHADQVYTDILNALEVLNEDGVIVCHDMNPQTELAQQIPFTGGHWNGDCWKAYVKLREERDDLDTCVIDTDEGCAVIKRGTRNFIGSIFTKDLDNLTYNDLKAERKVLLNLIDVNLYVRDIVQPTLLAYIYDTTNPETNWDMALLYQALGQYAAAVGFYIRTAERTDDKLLQYECMIRAAMCFDKQTIRKFSVKGMLLRAITLQPNRPEAYYMLGKITSNEQGDGNWFESYTWATLGVQADSLLQKDLRTIVDYPGVDHIRLQQGVAAWWCGLCDEARDIFFKLYEKDLPRDLKAIVRNNLQQFNGFRTNKLEQYNTELYDQVGRKFNNLSLITQNYSESFQDMFVLTMLDGKKNGTYVEIGGGDPFYGNNTALLETVFGWEGVTLEINPEAVNAYNQRRSARCALRDATTVDYDKFLTGLGFEECIDYLQLDCDPPEVTYRTLLNIPFEKYKFAVITYEHDYYCDETKSFRDKSRNFLRSHGYVLVAGNIAPDHRRAYEDWWVHPELIEPHILTSMLRTTDETVKAKDYMLGRKI